jgi:hypothetical protein
MLQLASDEVAALTETLQRVCNGECLQQTSVNDDSGDEEDDSFGDEDVDSLDYTSVSVNCPNSQPCVEQQCANFPVCKRTAPLWLLDCKGGICIQPCDMLFGQTFHFFSFADDEGCPVCFETECVAVKYPCTHLVCAGCFGTSVWDTDNVMKRCPICRCVGTPSGKVRLRRQ